mmetsp:Transcript_18241/g.25540  ORF Transcript_18241/g.25540 Transcript_18241/m.25540 type:complete len:216 (+) Transcript_18241:88-735(+)
MNKVLIGLCVLLGVFAAVQAGGTYGIDVSSAIYVNNFQCIKGDGYVFVVIRCWQSNGQADPNCPHTIYNAWDGGMEYVDVYMFPCYSCGNPSGQVKSMIDYLNSYNCKWGMVWFDIEGPQYWSSSTQNNVNFMQSMLNEGHTLGLNMGIYTSQSQWQPIMGSWTGGSGYPLWYAHYDDNPSFSDFVPFNGWSSPAIKQYYGDASMCGCDVDLDWY